MRVTRWGLGTKEPDVHPDRPRRTWQGRVDVVLPLDIELAGCDTTGTSSPGVKCLLSCVNEKDFGRTRTSTVCLPLGPTTSLSSVTQPHPPFSVGSGVEGEGGRIGGGRPSR